MLRGSICMWYAAGKVCALPREVLFGTDHSLASENSAAPGAWAPLPGSGGTSSSASWKHSLLASDAARNGTPLTIGCTPGWLPSNPVLAAASLTPVPAAAPCSASAPLAPLGPTSSSGPWPARDHAGVPRSPESGLQPAVLPADWAQCGGAGGVAGAVPGLGYGSVFSRSRCGLCGLLVAPSLGPSPVNAQEVRGRTGRSSLIGACLQWHNC